MNRLMEEMFAVEDQLIARFVVGMTRLLKLGQAKRELDHYLRRRQGCSTG